MSRLSRGRSRIPGQVATVRGKGGRLKNLRPAAAAAAATATVTAATGPPGVTGPNVGERIAERSTRESAAAIRIERGKGVRRIRTRRRGRNEIRGIMTEGGDPRGASRAWIS